MKNIHFSLITHVLIHLFFLLTMFEKKNDREKIEKPCQTIEQKDIGYLKHHFSAINSSTNSQNQLENRL